MVNLVIQALASVPRDRDVLNEKDDEISNGIRRIEAALVELRPGIPAKVIFGTHDGRHVLAFSKRNGNWRLMWGGEGDDDDQDVPLMTAPRHIRAEVFAEDPTTKLTPVDRLVIELSEQLVLVAGARDRFLVVAARLTSVLEAAVAELPR